MGDHATFVREGSKHHEGRKSEIQFELDLAVIEVLELGSATT